jgi:hypothetical protein
MTSTDLSTPDVQYQHIRNLRVLLPYEQAEYDRVFSLWQDARRRKDWREADRWRSVYAVWDTGVSPTGQFYYPLESWGNKRRRVFIRMKRYSLDIYPWDQKMLVGVRK